MKKISSTGIISFLFGIVFSFVGFVNMFWGNDPFFGLIIFMISWIFYQPILVLILEKIPTKFLLGIKIILGLLIVWSSLGVGELPDKIELMLNNFPNPLITGI